MKDIIKRLQDKNYVRAFGLMSAEEQRCFRKVGKKNCLFVSNMEIGWKQSPESGEFCFGVTYAINPDYQPEPEPEFVDYEIELLGGEWLGIKIDKRIKWPSGIYFSCRSTCLPGLEKFEGFYLKDSRDRAVEVRPEWVARNHPNVIARFGA